MSCIICLYMCVSIYVYIIYLCVYEKSCVRVCVSICIYDLGACFVQYKAKDIKVTRAGKMELVFTPADGSPPERHHVFDFPSLGVAMGMYNTAEVRP